MAPELRTLLSFFPPWVVASLLLGLICGSSAFIIAGRRLLGLPLYLVLGALGALLGQIASLALELQPWPVTFGQVHLAMVACSALILLSIARLYRL